MKSLWSVGKANTFDDMELVVYVSNLLGADETLVQGGGGNTSVKVEETDFFGRPKRVLRVKASGFSLRTIGRQGFAGVRLEEILPLKDREQMSDEEMVEYIAHTLMSPLSPRPSIETLLHGFLPHKWVLHTHSNAILSLANNEQSVELIRDILGSEMAIIPYRRPGFLLAKQVGEAVNGRKGCTGAILLHHGLITFAEDCREAYERHIDYVDTAESRIRAALAKKSVFMPVVKDNLKAQERQAAALLAASALRGAVSSRAWKVLAYDDSPEVMEFADSDRVSVWAHTGPATPEHVLSIKPYPLVVPTDDLRDGGSLRASVRRAVADYEEKYRDYYLRHLPEGSDYSMHDPFPRVAIIPGLGMWGIGANAREASNALEIYKHKIGIAAGADALGAFMTVSEAAVFDVDYWPLELYKLSMLPKPKELEGRVAVITGGAKGIGLAVARKFLAEGANVVISDIDDQALNDSVNGLVQEFGKERIHAAVVDVTREASVQEGMRQALLRFGGIDIVVSNAGIAPIGSIQGLSLSVWERSMAVNATGHFLVAREAVRIMTAQGRGGSLIFIATKNVPAPGKEFGAYSCAKAAEAQLCRILAQEHGKDKIRANMINPDAVFTDLWSEEVKRNRAQAYGVALEDFESFLVKRTLLQEQVTAEDVAEAAFYLAGDRSRVTTGSMIPVDAGAREAFPR